MARECHCGCGRPVAGLRKRANDSAASQMTEDLAVLHGALHSDGSTGGDADLVALAAEGDVLLDRLRACLHDEVDRADVDRSATRDWLVRARSARRSLDRSGDGPPWVPDEPGTDVLVHTGARGVGVVSSVERSGWGNERVAELTVQVTLRGADGEPITLDRRVSVAVTHAPRVGDQVEVAHDPASGRFAYRPRVVLPDDA